jgi:hypothetical protein
MKAAVLVAVLLWQAAPAKDPPVAQPEMMRYMRELRMPAGGGQTCAVLDAPIFPHAEPSLNDLRLFPLHTAGAHAHETPYAITLSEPATEETEPARVLNLGTGEDGSIVFDLEMPRRPYTDVTLNLDPAAHDFLATATVSGGDTETGARTSLGSFTLFDLASQHLSRDTTLPLSESSFGYLHVSLRIAAAHGANADAPRFVPGIVDGAQVPPSREAQTLYTTIAETSSIATVGRESRAAFDIPARVPVERISFQLANGFTGNFSRDVRITALAKSSGPADAERTPMSETVNGSILRVHEDEQGREIRTEQLGVAAILGSNLQSAAKVEVTVENGDDQPLPIVAVRLEMRQRKICFDAAAAGGDVGLYYGDPRLIAPVYDYQRMFVASDKAAVAQLGPEMENPRYRPSADTRSFTERHPETLWIALLVVIGALGTVALHSARKA